MATEDRAAVSRSWDRACLQRSRRELAGGGKVLLLNYECGYTTSTSIKTQRTAHLKWAMLFE